VGTVARGEVLVSRQGVLVAQTSKRLQVLLGQC